MVLANGSTGLTFGILLRGDEVEAKKQMERLLSSEGLKVSVVNIAGSSPDKSFLELAKVGIYGSEANVGYRAFTGHARFECPEHLGFLELWPIYYTEFPRDPGRSSEKNHGPGRMFL